jgi:hypothetical protein
MKYADERTVQQAMQTWSESQIACRASNNHHWSPLTVFHDRYLRYLRITERCQRCLKVERWREIREDGYPLTGWSIIYSPGYLLPPGSGRVDADGRAAFNRTVLARFIGAAETTTTIRRARDSEASPPRGKWNK